MSADVLNEHDYYEMPSDYYDRRAQIPLKQERFDYLLNKYSPKQGDRWVMFNHPNHFLIYDNSSGFCIYDAEYVLFEDSEQINPIVAVITSFRTNKNPDQHQSDTNDDFEALCEILKKIL